MWQSRCRSKDCNLDNPANLKGIMFGTCRATLLDLFFFRKSFAFVSLIFFSETTGWVAASRCSFQCPYCSKSADNSGWRFFPPFNFSGLVTCTAKKFHLRLVKVAFPRRLSIVLRTSSAFWEADKMTNYWRRDVLSRSFTTSQLNYFGLLL